MTTTKKSKIGGIIYDHCMIALGLLLYAITWNFFLFPHRIATGGGTGIAAIVMYATQGLLSQPVQDFFATLGMNSIGGGIPISATYFVLNAVLLILSVKILGLEFSLKSIFGVMILTVWLWIPYPEVYENLFGEPFPVFDPFMSSIIAGVFCGVGLALVLVNNGSSGGTDIIAKIINKYKTVSLGRALLLCDVVVITSSGFLPDSSIKNIVYGLVVMVVMTTTVDMYINGVRQSVQFFIFSKKYEEIAEAISKQAKRGVTLIDGEGWYSKQQIKIITVMTRKTESTQIFKLIKEIDPDAFISQSAAIGVYGKGFEEIGQH